VIVAVDDDPVNLAVIENLCRSKRYVLLTAADGPTALGIIETNEIDLVLLDLMLPGMSGYEVCRKIRRMEKGRYVPVVMVTARDQMGDLTRGFRTGANDYITKPFKRQELILRIENQLAIKQILDMEKSVINGLKQDKASLSSLFQRSVDLKESTLQMLEWEKIIREDLSVARAFQEKLMTHERPITGIETRVHYHPIMDVGGDIYDIVEHKPGIVRIFLADATGHGITASLNTVKILTEYAAVKYTLESPSEIAGFLNQRFTQNFRPYGIVFTCVIADIDLVNSNAVIATAGMPHQFIRRGGEVAVIGPMNPIIGLSPGSSYRDERHSFNRGDILFLHSDGINEMIEDNRGRREKRVEESIEVLANAIASAYHVASLSEAGSDLINRFGGLKNITVDDVTFIAVKKLT
jgi:CheY-like chemotaxis protein